ncbi:MAG: hypothetical protein V4631_07965 [Pseudomonadota bacterium]
MPILGLGVHFLIALFFAVHVVRTGRELYWLILLFSFPLLGSLVYFLAIFLPQSRLERTLGKAVGAVGRSLDPGRAMREAQQAFDLTPTAHNQTRLAGAMLEAGMYSQAVEQFEACLRGPFSGDPEIRFAAAQARLANNQADAAIGALLELRKTHPGFRQEQLAVLLAKSYAAAGKHADAGAEFAEAVTLFSGIETRAEYALWALSRRDQVVADAQLKELHHTRKHMTKYTRSLHQELFKRLDAAEKMQQSR